ncbi:MAG: hypothetical protein QM725_02015 [Lacibacter sp.]
MKYHRISAIKIAESRILSIRLIFVISICLEQLIKNKAFCRKPIATRTPKCATQQEMPVAANAGHKKRMEKRSFFFFKLSLEFETANGLMVGKFHYLCRLVK